MNIFFCINRLALLGFGATISSLLRHCSDSSKLHLWFLCSDLNATDKENIKRLLNRENFKGNFQISDINPTLYFEGMRPLHGDWTAYGRLLVTDIINEDQVLYLDADLIVEVDILQLSNFNLNGFGVAAVSDSTLAFALDSSFLHEKLNISKETRYFNSGVLLISLAYWREFKIKEKLFELAERYPNDIISHDQTLLNAIFKGKFAFLPVFFNSPWYAGKSRPDNADNMILHYLGSPKPWDIGAKFIHSGYTTWKEYLDHDWNAAYGRLTNEKLARAWKIRNSYFRVIKKSFGV